MKLSQKMNKITRSFIQKFSEEFFNNNSLFFFNINNILEK